ncbi:MAG: insulinase family protein [bacterium]
MTHIKRMAPEPQLKAGDKTDGFVVLSVTQLHETCMTAYRLEHINTGARLLHLDADDDENLFSIAFPTPPPDDTGLPHIIEHSVLSGSEKYPVRDPFFEMARMSMATFINAMTGYDCTYYPVASNVRQDLFNLADVYFDAVFHPMLSKSTFHREAHHFAPADKKDPTGSLTINGVVYSEMKGVYSHPEHKLSYLIVHSLFPDTVFSLDSGGKPDAIPGLTYDDFRNYHRTFYQPSLAYFVTYGNNPVSQYLQFLDIRLARFKRTTATPSIVRRQPRWQQPRTLEDAYPIGADESLKEKTYIILSWIVGDGLSPADITSLEVLGLILLGNEGAPLRKAIIDSKLGQDTFCPGLQIVGPESSFGIGLKGSEPENTGAFVSLVLNTLKQCATDGFDRNQVLASFQQAAYQRLEVHSGYPLHVMDSTLSSWVYGSDPLAFLHMKEHLATCRKKYEDDPNLFSRLVTERLIQSMHRLTLVLRPDQTLQARTDAAFTEHMIRVRAGFSDKQARDIATEADELEELSGTPNSPEAIAMLPQLKVKDLPAKPKHIPTTVEQMGGGNELLVNDVFSNGVNYLNLSFDLAGMPADLWPYLAQYTDAVQKLGAAGMNYEQVSRRIAAHTGGISCWPWFQTRCNRPDQPLFGLQFSIKALDDQMEPALELLRDLVFAVEPGDRNRLHDVLIQDLAQCRTELVFGAGAPPSHAGRGHTPQAYLADLVNGLPQLPLVTSLTSNFDKMAQGLISKIESIRDTLLVRGRVTASFTGSDRGAEAVRRSLATLLQRMRTEQLKDAPTGFVPFVKPPREGLAAPIEVAHCAQVMPAPHFSHPHSIPLVLGTHIVSMDYMINELRFKGNAYGASCRYDSLGSMLYLTTFRDPHVARTLKVFDKLVDYVRGIEWTQADIDRAIIGVAKGDERPIRPESATHLAIHRHLIGHTRQLREERHDRLCQARPAEVRTALLETLESGPSKASVCAIASRRKLEDSNREMPETPLSIQDVEPAEG